MVYQPKLGEQVLGRSLGKVTTRGELLAMFHEPVESWIEVIMRHHERAAFGRVSRAGLLCLPERDGTIVFGNLAADEQANGGFSAALFSEDNRGGRMIDVAEDFPKVR